MRLDKAFEVGQWLVQHLGIEKIQGAVRLVLLGGRYLQGHRQIRQEFLHIASVQPRRIFQLVKEYVAADAVAMAVLGARRKTLVVDGRLQFVKQVRSAVRQTIGGLHSSGLYIYLLLS